MAFKNRYFKWAAGISLFLVLLSLLSNIWIITIARKNIYTEIGTLPENKVGLLLGASKSIKGYPNLFFVYRIRAAAALYHAGKIHRIIVSGDNHVKTYDEATDMRDALILEGVPDSCITLDYAGFRTLDSVVRCKEVFGQDKFTIISQEFHNQRALFIASRYGFSAVAFNARDVPSRYSTRVLLREYFAKFKAVLDLYVFNTKPKFLGEKVLIR
jgi:SanA protein